MKIKVRISSEFSNDTKILLWWPQEPSKINVNPVAVFKVLTKYIFITLRDISHSHYSITKFCHYEYPLNVRTLW